MNRLRPSAPVVRGSAGSWPSRRSLGLALAVALGGWILTAPGCASGSGKSTEPGADSEDPRAGLERPPLSEANQKLARGCLSAVLISGHPRVTVVETVESVFTAAGLQLKGRPGDSLVFERTAGRKLSAAYGSWSGDEARIRLQVDLYQEGTLQYFLRCRSFIARAAGSGVEDQQSLARRHVREYEGLLDEVATRLD